MISNHDNLYYISDDAASETSHLNYLAEYAEYDSDT